MKTRSLGELEQKVMEIIWKKKRGSIGDVLKEIKKERRVAYTTIATILQRLNAKGLLLKEGHFYLPKFSKSEYSTGLIKSFLKNITSAFGDVAIASFAASIENLPRRKREHLLKLLKDYKDK